MLVKLGFIAEQTLANLANTASVVALLVALVLLVRAGNNSVGEPSIALAPTGTLTIVTQTTEVTVASASETPTTLLLSTSIPRPSATIEPSPAPNPTATLVLPPTALPTATFTLIPTLPPTDTPLPPSEPPSPSVAFTDSFNTNTLDNYQTRGIIAWESTSQQVRSDGVPRSDSAMYFPLRLSGSFVASGRVFIPSSDIGSYDSISLALRGGQTEYWGILFFGNDLIEKNNVAISRNDRGGPMYPLVLSSGWYTIKMQVDQNAKLIQMKTWADGTGEPEWQVVDTLEAGWTLSSVGFRHAGDSSSWMDDLVVTQLP